MGVGEGVVPESGEGKWRQLYLNNSKNKNKKIHEWTNKEIKIKLHMPWGKKKKNNSQAYCFNSVKIKYVFKDRVLKEKKS